MASLIRIASSPLHALRPPLPPPKSLPTRTIPHGTAGKRAGRTLQAAMDLTKRCCCVTAPTGADECAADYLFRIHGCEPSPSAVSRAPGSIASAALTKLFAPADKSFRNGAWAAL
mmetsp:Transcript_44736/g.101034  ORF Transcript_44736/g.101034 Transcript_44736/m.101034 type:complete len:115 (-) Transcript_44736:124-468(-)